MTKNHATNPRWKRLIRNGEARMRRAMKRLPVHQSQRQVINGVSTTSRDRCQVRDRFGHRCKVHGPHDTHRAFGREFLTEAGG